MPGQGGSKILHGSYHVKLSEQVDVMNSVINYVVGHNNFNILSASWGGAVASAYASLYSSRANKLLLAAFGLKANHNMKKAIQKSQFYLNAGKKCWQAKS